MRCGIFERTQLGTDSKPLSSASCHIAGITRNIYKHVREQFAVKETQPTREREVEPHEHKRAELFVKDSNLSMLKMIKEKR